MASEHLGRTFDAGERALRASIAMPELGGRASSRPPPSPIDIDERTPIGTYGVACSFNAR
jgi:hypothetical protein